MSSPAASAKETGKKPSPERRIHALQKKAVSLEAAQLFLGITRRLWAAAEA